MLSPAPRASPGLTPLIVLGVVAVVFIVSWFRDRKRDADLRSMVARLGLIGPGRVLPHSLTLQGTELEGATSIWNVIEADRSGIEVVAFDCRIVGDRSSYLRTAIAARGPRDVFGAAKFATDLAVERSGDWSIMYTKTRSGITQGIMPASEIEAHFDSIGP
jgi:hypothetical protein